MGLASTPLAPRIPKFGLHGGEFRPEAGARCGEGFGNRLACAESAHALQGEDRPFEAVTAVHEVDHERVRLAAGDAHALQGMTGVVAEFSGDDGSILGIRHASEGGTPSRSRIGCA